MCKKILISGWYGYGNIGDEAILKAIMDECVIMHPGCEISVLSFIPDYNKKHHTKFSYYQIPIGGVRSWLAFFVKLRFLKTLYQFYKCDIFIMGGGGFLSDWQPEVPLGWLKQFRVAKYFRKKTKLYGIGAGPFNSEKGKRIVKRYIEKYVDDVTVRDQYSYNALVESCGIKENLITIKVDPVANLNCENYLSNKKDHSIVCIYTPHFDRKIWKEKRYKWDELKECYVAQINCLLQKGEEVKLVFFQKNVEKDLACYLKEVFGSRVAVLFPDGYQEAIEIIGSSKAVISFRLHGSILAHAIGIPYLPIIYHHKAKGFLDIVGYSNSDLAINVGEGINWFESDLNKENWVNKTEEFLTRL